MSYKIKSTNPLNNTLTAEITSTEHKLRQDILQQVIENIAMMYKLMGSSRDQFLASHGISKPQLEVLTILSEKPLRIKCLASKLHVTSSAVTQIVNNLSVMGLLQRTASPTDNRSVVVCLSIYGQTRFRKIKQAYIERIEETLVNVDQCLLTDLQRITNQIMHSVETLDKPT